MGGSICSWRFKICSDGALHVVKLAATPSSDALNDHGHRVATSQAKRSEASPHSTLLHRVEQTHEDPSPGGSDRVAQSDGTTMHVHLGLVQL
jgi:hypothetical protein